MFFCLTKFILTICNFKDGVITASSFDIADSNVAAVSLDGNSLKIKGSAQGTVKASVKSSDGNTHEFVITVRKTAGNSWM